LFEPHLEELLRSLSELDQRRLKKLPPEDQDTVLRVMHHHPKLTVTEAIRDCKAAGM